MFSKAYIDVLSLVLELLVTNNSRLRSEKSGIFCGNYAVVNAVNHVLDLITNFTLPFRCVRPSDHF